MLGGKELQTELDLGWSDFGNRCLDNWSGKWLGIDILGEVKTSISLYAYGLNNPVRFSDHTGMIEEDQNGLMSVSTSLEGRGSGFADKQASEAKERAKRTQNEQANPTKSINVALVGKNRDDVLETDYKELLKTDYKVLEVNSGKDAYRKLKNLTKEGYSIKNLFISSHGAAYDFNGSYRFKIGNVKYKTIKGAKNSTWLKNIGSLISSNGAMIIGSCHAGSSETNGEKLMTTITRLINRDVYASRSWVYTSYGSMQRGSNVQNPGYPNGDYAVKNDGVWIKVTPIGQINEYNNVTLRTNGNFKGAKRINTFKIIYYIERYFN